MNVFICMPYGSHLPSHERQANVCLAIEVFHLLADAEEIYPYCPHLSHFAHQQHYRPRCYWLTLAHKYMEMCDCVIAIGKPTPGMKKELREAHRLNIPVFYGEDYDTAFRKLTEAYGLTPPNGEYPQSTP